VVDGGRELLITRQVVLNIRVSPSFTPDLWIFGRIHVGNNHEGSIPFTRSNAGFSQVFARHASGNPKVRIKVRMRESQPEA
jgi:hypothetical protein